MNHIDDYDDLTAVEIIDLLSENSYSTEELREIKTYEAENKDRVTVQREVDELLVSDTDVGDETDADDTAEASAARTVEINTESMSTNDDENSAKDGEIDEENLSPQADDDDAVENPQGDPDTVRVRLGRSGYAAGYQFDDALEEKEVAYNRRVELAIERGTLTRV